MVEQSGSFASPGEPVYTETAHVNFGRRSTRVRPAVGVLTTGRTANRLTRVGYGNETLRAVPDSLAGSGLW